MLPKILIYPESQPKLQHAVHEKWQHGLRMARWTWSRIVPHAIVLGCYFFIGLLGR